MTHIPYIKKVRHSIFMYLSYISISQFPHQPHNRPSHDAILPYRYGGGKVIINRDKAMTLTEQSFHIATPGTYDVTVDLRTMTMNLHSDTYVSKYPDHVYLIGANGSGKSTLMNVLNGHEKIAKSGGYEGQIFMDGEEVYIKDHMESTRHGISMVHQELALFPGMTVTENIKINKEHTKGKGFLLPELALLDKEKNEADASQLLGRIGTEISPRADVEFLTLNQKQFVEIARELDNAKIHLLILDEPTSSLNITETQKLLACVRDIAAAGIAVIFISHRLEEIMDVCDKVFILRDGQLISAYEKAAFSVDRFAEDMVGTEVIKASREKKLENRPVLLEYQNIQGSG